MGAEPEPKVRSKGAAEPQTEVMLPPILRLPWPEQGSLHAHALQRYLAFLQELHDEVPLDCLTDEDLTEKEQAKRNECSRRIVRWLERCSADAGAPALSVYPYSSGVIYNMRDLKALLKTANERKMERARLAVKEKERQTWLETEKKRRQAALKEIDPPLHDAEKYLSSQEQQQFIDSIVSAVDAYLARDVAMEAIHPGFWMIHRSATAYCYWTKVIEERRNADIRKRRAQKEYQERVDRMATAANKVREQLKAHKKPLLSALPALNGHQPGEWGELYLPENEKIAAWAEAELRKRLPPELGGNIRWKLTREMLVTPQPIYENSDGIPCLTWHFNALVLVEAELWLNTILKQSPIKQPVKGNSGSEKLGTLYLGPREWSVVGVLTTPLALLSMLLTEEKEASGITVLERDGEFTVFAISGMGEETVEIADDFREFIREVAGEKGISKGLQEAGFIDVDTAVLIDAKKGLPLPSPIETLGQADPTDADSEVRKTLMDMGYQEQMVDEALAAVSFSGNMSLQQKVAAALEVMHS